MNNFVQFYKKTALINIDNSFLLDGVDEYFYIPNADVTTYLQGSNPFSILTSFRINDLSHINTLFSSWGATPSINMNVSTVGTLAINLRSGGSNSTTANTTIMLDTWYNIVFVYDPSEATGFKGKFYVDFTEDTLGDFAPPSVDSSSSDYYIGNVEGISSRYLEGNQGFFSIIKKSLSASEVLSLRDKCGNFKNPQYIFGNDVVGVYSPDTSGSTAQFVMNDIINSTTATSVNLEDSDKVLETPYGC